MIKAGEFEINVWKGGYPVWSEIYYQGEKIAQISHKELSDLEYAVKKAKIQAVCELGQKDAHEVG